VTGDMQKRVRANAERLRAEIFSSHIPNLHQAAQVNQTLKSTSPVTLENSNEDEETATGIDEGAEQTPIRITVLVEPQVLNLLDEFIQMNLALDRENAAEIMFRLGCNTHKELILAHAEQRKKLQEIREKLHSSLYMENA